MNRNGIKLIENFISEEQEKELIGKIDDQEWSHVLQRRVQHYGYQYEYKTRTLKKLLDPEIPSWLVPSGLDAYLIPEQIIVNEYLNGQGISRHTDSSVFGPIICSLSLGVDTIMHLEGFSISHDLKLPRRSLLILEGYSRYKMTHEIKHKGDRRISITYRTIAQK